MSTSRSTIVGLTGIGARRSEEPSHLPIFYSKPKSHAAAYFRHPQTDLVGVCDIRQEQLDAFKEEWQDIWPEMHYYTDYKEMQENEKPDMVSVATPDHFHADITVNAAEGGAKAILCEKPLATTLEDVARMIAATEANDTLLSVEHTRRWGGTFHAVRELIRSGELGRLNGITANLLGPRSMLFRNGTHIVDTICFFAESAPQWVFAELEEGFSHFTEYKGDGGKDPATDPAASGYIHFANGIRAFYNGLKTTSSSGSDWQLFCEKGRIDINNNTATVIESSFVSGSSRTILEPDEYMHTHQLGAVAELIDVLENGGELVSPGTEARKTVQILLMFLKSHELGNLRVDL